MTKTIGVRDLQAHVSQALDDAQQGPVVVMRHARPVAVVIGVEDGDLADVLQQAAALKMAVEKGK